MAVVPMVGLTAMAILTPNDEPRSSLVLTPSRVYVCLPTEFCPSFRVFPLVGSIRAPISSCFPLLFFSYLGSFPWSSVRPASDVWLQRCSQWQPCNSIVHAGGQSEISRNFKGGARQGERVRGVSELYLSLSLSLSGCAAFVH